jgi:hypothetical protein
LGLGLGLGCARSLPGEKLVEGAAEGGDVAELQQAEAKQLALVRGVSTVRGEAR